MSASRTLERPSPSAQGGSGSGLQFGADTSTSSLSDASNDLQGIGQLPEVVVTADRVVPDSFGNMIAGTLALVGITIALGGGAVVGAAGAEGTLYSLGRQLAREEAESAFTETGELSREALQGARQFSPEEIGNPAVPEGFGKYATETFRSPSGPFQVHFYQNPVTDEVFYGLDYKAVFNRGIIPYSVGGP